MSTAPESPFYHPEFPDFAQDVDVRANQRFTDYPVFTTLEELEADPERALRLLPAVRNAALDPIREILTAARTADRRVNPQAVLDNLIERLLALVIPEGGSPDETPSATYPVTALDAVLGQVEGKPYIVRDALRAAVEHARPIIEDEQAEATVSQAELALAEEALAASESITETQVHALAETVELGLEYMLNNNYGEDDDFPADVLAVSSMGNSGSDYLYAILDMPTWYYPEGSDSRVRHLDIAQKMACDLGVSRVRAQIGQTTVAWWHYVTHRDQYAKIFGPGMWSPGWGSPTPQPIARTGVGA